MNHNLFSNQKTKNKCVKLRLLSKKSIALEEFVEKSDDVTIYKIRFQTLPGYGLFTAMLVKDDANNGTLSILNDQITRINGYGSQAKCAITSYFAPYCYCKNLL